VLAAVDAVRARGIPIRLDLVEGVSRDEALARCAQADIAIDQLKIGWYGGFAVEAMALGKPVLCHVQDESPGDNPFGRELGLVRTTATSLVDDLIALIEDPERRRQAGAAGRAFVERHHDPRAVARRVLDGLVEVPGDDGRSTAVG
jgi:glycosyltransferase involved in cell wall biosynthesis